MIPVLRRYSVLSSERKLEAGPSCIVRLHIKKPNAEDKPTLLRVRVLDAELVAEFILMEER